MSSPKVEQPFSWWKRWKQSQGIIGLTSGSLWVFLWNLERIIGLAGAPEDISRWQQGVMRMMDLILAWAPSIGLVFLGGAIVSLSFFIAEKLDRFWTRRLLYRFRKAVQQLGWVTVRYGIVQDGATRKELWFDSRKVWKGKETRVFFPESRRHGGSLCFIEFPESYEVAFLSNPWRHYWPEYNSPTPGYRRYASNLPLTNQTALFIVGTDDRGTGGWSAAWKELWYGGKARVSGVDSCHQTGQQNTKSETKTDV